MNNQREAIQSIAGGDLADGLTTFTFDPTKDIIPAPEDPALWPAFREQLAKWREETRNRLNYDDILYRQPAFSWAAKSYSCYFMMIYDERFYDKETGQYTVESLLDEGVREFGGYDSLVLWNAYPRIGVDQRNQFDFYRDMPGGLAGVRNVVHSCQKRGVKVHIVYNPWDIGTRRDDKTDLDMLIELVRELEVDGIFLDAMGEGSAGFRARLDAVRPGVVLEGEWTPTIERLKDHHASWAQNFSDSKAPGVLRHKWFERRHMQHGIRRWDFDHSGEIHTAWINGSGMMVWENVYGSWVAWNKRDRSLLRSILNIQRRYSDLFSGEGWEPLVPVEKPDVYASLWTNGKLRLWTLVNRSENEVEGTLLKINNLDGQRCFDLIAGTELKPVQLKQEYALEARMHARGVGCFLVAPTEELGKDFERFLASQASTQSRFESNTDHPVRETHLISVIPTLEVDVAPAGMVAVRPAPIEPPPVQMRIRECGFYDSHTEDKKGFWVCYGFMTRQFEQRVQPHCLASSQPGEPPADRAFEKRVQLHSFAMDETPVTNAQFAEFLRASHYRPTCVDNFLKHWNNGQPPEGMNDHPVVWIDLDDARAYARWAGKRLPTEEEWQYAAQGGDGLEYPWGNGIRAGVCNLGETGTTTPVKAFPDGCSPCGCYDMCGNVWQWTESERTDGRTRFCIIRGGSYFVPKGSPWYVDGGPRPAYYATKFLMMWPGLDRCATIGFRCAKDMD